MKQGELEFGPITIEYETPKDGDAPQTSSACISMTLAVTWKQPSLKELEQCWHP
jgi:hypothetical protein